MKKSLLFCLFILFSFAVFGADEETFYEKESVFSVSKNGSLSFDKLDDELFVPLKNENGAVLVRRSADSVVRGFYDNLHRLIKKEIWEISTLDESHILKLETYGYKNNNLKTLTVTTDKNKTVVTYNENGKVVSEVNYALVGDREVKESDTSYSWKDDFLFRKTELTWTYSKENYSGKAVKLTKKWDYVKNGGDIPDDYTYSENGTVKVVKKYTGLEDFELTSFFDEGFQVVAIYEDGIKVSEIMYSNGKVLRKML